jgi:23S rRNA (cytidine1920-2'-O)/16S rRNA (cytidine1409-2'-O)-methyltransferase
MLRPIPFLPPASWGRSLNFSESSSLFSVLSVFCALPFALCVPLGPSRINLYPVTFIRFLTMPKRLNRQRLDQLLVARNLAPSREKAQAMILSGEVSVNGAPITKSGHSVPQDASIEIRSRLQKYVSRGGFKLEGALKDFSVNPREKICLDLGSSNGGFTDCLLQHGATRVFAVDVNTDQLDWKLQQDPRVVRTKRNARELQPQDLPEPPNLVVADVSFISITKILPAVVPCAAHGADFLILIKPQFELRREDIGPGGIVSDPALHQRAIQSVQSAAESLALETVAIKPSHLPGAEGNQEFFLHSRKPL